MTEDVRAIGKAGLRRRCGLRAAAAAMASAVVGALPAIDCTAADVLWGNAAGGSFSATGNWVGNQVPAPADAAVFPIASGAYTVTFGSNVTTAMLVARASGTVTLGLAGTTYLVTGAGGADPLIVGQNNGDKSGLTISAGTLQTSSPLGGAVYVGSAAGSIGTINLPPGATWTDDAADEIIGYGGAGTVNQTGGTHGAASLTIGFLTTSVGRYALGGGSLTVTGNESLGFIGNGTGTFDQTGGSHSAGSLLLVNRGTFNLSGGTLVVSGAVTATDAANVFNQTGGTHTASSLTLAYNPGSSAQYKLGPTGSLTVGSSVVVGYAGSADFTQTGGTHLVNGTGTNGLLVGYGAGALGSYTLGSGGTVTANAVVLGGSPTAAGGIGTLTVNGGSFNALSSLRVFGTVSGTNRSGVTQTGGTLRATGAATLDGTFTQTGGVANFGAVSGTGTLSIGAASGGTASTTVASIAQSAVTINNTGSLRIATAGVRLTSSIGALSMGSSTAAFDIGNHDVLITGATSAINALVKRAAGVATGPTGQNPWNGVGGITSALVRADAFAGHPGQQAIGVKNNADFVANGGKAVPAGKVLVSYAAYGDANLDNNVDIADLSIWNNNFGVGDHWGQGDFNYDGQVDIADLSVWNNNFGGNVSPSAPANNGATPQHKALASAGVMASAASLSGDAPAHANATPPAGTMELDIDPSTGRAYLNSGGVSLAAIQIDSSTKNMTPGTGAGNNWNSFRLTQGYNLKGWGFAKGTPNTGSLVESTSDATSGSGFPINLPSGTVYDYGAIFPVGFGLNAGDLATIKFQYNYVNDAQAGTTTNVIGVVALTPEPGSVVGLLGLLGAGLLGRRRRRRSRKPLRSGSYHDGDETRSHTG